VHGAAEPLFSDEHVVRGRTGARDEREAARMDRDDPLALGRPGVARPAPHPGRPFRELELVSVARRQEPVEREVVELTEQAFVTRFADAEEARDLFRVQGAVLFAEDIEDVVT
jgi:hypothetical protein